MLHEEVIQDVKLIKSNAFLEQPSLNADSMPRTVFQFMATEKNVAKLPTETRSTTTSVIAAHSILATSISCA